MSPAARDYFSKWGSIDLIVYEGKPTGPIAALAILGKVGLPPRLEAIINGESLFNDGVGVVLNAVLFVVNCSF